MNRAVDLCAGPGGWDVAADALGVEVVGLERDASACLTRAAAGHLTIRADVTAYDPARFAGYDGVIGSMPCPTFSTAGKGAGVKVMHLLDLAIREAFRGEQTKALRTRQMARLLRADVLARSGITKVEAAAWAWRNARMSALMVQPARWVLAIEPRWVALEQVPAVLPLFRTYADQLRTRGYSVWCGVLDAADFGVPQRRKRAFVMAHMDRPAVPPEPTHAERPGVSLFGVLEPQVTMADALGWGMTARPCVTVMAGSNRQGGVSPLDGGSGARRTIERERERGRFVVRTRGDSGREHDEFDADRASRTVTGKTDSWVVDRRTNSKAAGGGHGADRHRPDV